MSSETHHLEPHTVKRFFGKLLVLNDTDHMLIVEALQVETGEGQKFTLNIKTPEPEKIPEPEQVATA
jgi:hypothetical protein